MKVKTAVHKKHMLLNFTQHNLKKLITLWALLFVGVGLFAQEVTVLTINNAQQTEYKKNEETGNDTIVLTGSVELSVVKGGTSSVIKADKISYDRVTEMLLAEGNVEISTTGGSAGGENASASSLLMNTSTLEGVFADGRVIQTQSDAINLPSGSTLIVFSEVFGKSASNTIAFKNSSLTFCDDENPHWHIDATRTWLLPGGEFAFFNAILYVGPVPVFYLPAFYYPKDELIFNPSFGYRERSGYFINTTTYLMGRKPLDSSSSSDSSSSDESLQALYNFMKPSSLKEQERQGLVLHNLDKDYTGDTTHYIKLMTDWYSNLGAMVGLDGNLAPSNKYVTNLKFTLDLGFSNTVFSNTGSYIPISSAGQRYWDKSNFLGMKLPFRYGGNIDLTLSQPFKFTLSLPFYSDPYFSGDFKKRQESMDWISLITSNKNNDDTTVSEVSSYIWKVSASYSLKLPDFMKPYVSSASFTYNSSINVSSTTNQDIGSDSRAAKGDGWRSYSPERKFYQPSTVTPAALTMNFAGTLFQYPKESKSSSSKFSFPVALTKPDELKTPAELEKELQEKQKEAESENSRDEKSQTSETDDSSQPFMPVLPELSVQVPSMTSIQGLNYRLGYTFNPSLNSQISYSSVSNPNDFKWNDIKATMYSIKAPLTFSSNLSYGGSFFSMSNRLSYEPIWQRHPKTDGYDATQKASIVVADYNAESQNILSTNSISINPFVLIPAFSDTGISWNSSMKLFRRKFIGDADNPEWEDSLLDFTDSESVTTHSLDFKFSAKEANSRFSQIFTYKTTLAPQVPRHSFKLDLGFPYVTANLGTSIHETSATDKTVVYEPLQQSMTVSLFSSPNTLRFTESWNWNFKEKHNDSLKLSLIWKQISTSFVMNYTNGYDFDSDNGWIAKSQKEFLPYSLSMTYSPSSKTYKFFSEKVTLSAGLNTSMVADLIRPTNSYFLFSPSVTFKINEAFSLTFSSTSKNSVIYRYFQSALGYDGRIPGEQNPFVDLWNSFRFDDVSKRKGSGFKLKSMNMTLNHELHDWDFTLSMKFEPRLVTKNGSKYYDYNPYVSLGIFWRPMSSIKTKIVDDYGTLKLE